MILSKRSLILFCHLFPFTRYIMSGKWYDKLRKRGRYVGTPWYQLMQAKHTDMRRAFKYARIDARQARLESQKYQLRKARAYQHKPGNYKVVQRRATWVRPTFTRDTVSRLAQYQFRDQGKGSRARKNAQMIRANQKRADYRAKHGIRNLTY